MLTTREATPADTEAVASLLDVDRRAAERLCRDRAVLIAVESEGDPDPDPEREHAGTDGAAAGGRGDGSEAGAGEAGDREEMEELGSDPNARAVLAYEVRPDAVHVARLGGSDRGVETLLTEPERFAAAEGLPVEAVVPAADEGTRQALGNAGFEAIGDGPTFEGDRTIRYRLARERD
jgi:hypothetical protein